MASIYRLKKKNIFIYFFLRRMVWWNRDGDNAISPQYLLLLFKTIVWQTTIPINTEYGCRQLFWLPNFKCSLLWKIPRPFVYNKEPIYWCLNKRQITTIRVALGSLTIFTSSWYRIRQVERRNGLTTSHHIILRSPRIGYVQHEHIANMYVQGQP